MTAIKYSTTSVNGAIKSNNIVIGNNTADYGPTSSTGFYGAIPAPPSGYTIYSVNGASHIPTAVIAHNDDECIWYAKSFGGTNINTIGDAITYFLTGSTGTTVVNMDHPSIITSGLTLNLDSRLVYSYPKQGTIWKDLSGNNYHGILYGATYNSGYISFDGNDSYVDLPAITLPTNITICAWICRTGAVNTYSPIVEQGSARPFRVIFLSNGGLCFGNDALINNFYWSSGIATELNVWYNIVAIYDGSHRIFCNGVEVSLSQAFGQYEGWGGSTLRIGYRAYTESVSAFNGFIPTVQIYNRALTPSEIQQNYYDVVMPGIVTDGLSLSLDAGSTFSYFNVTGNTWYDLSIYKNNVSFLGEITYSDGTLAFDGDTGLIDFYAPNLTTTATVEMVFKMNTEGDMPFGWDTYDVYSYAGLGYNTANSDQYGLSPSQVSSLGLVGNWRHYIFEMRSDVSYTNNKIYINGVNQSLSQNTSSENVGTRTFNSGNGRISGWKMGGYQINMDLGLFRIYSRSLSQYEISQNYAAVKSRFNL